MSLEAPAEIIFGHLGDMGAWGVQFPIFSPGYEKHFTGI